MNIDFPFILTIAVLLSGIISLLDILFLTKRRLAKGQAKPGKIVEYSRSFFPVLLLVLVIRSFIVQPFRVPTGSLEPTVMPGDFIAVNQFAYGLRLPVINTKIVSISEPKTGQIAVFRWPIDTSVDFVKRVIGVPGDHIQYKNKVLYINGKEAIQSYVGFGTDYEPAPEGNIPVQQYMEDLNGVKHLININPNAPAIDFDITVPAGEYFMMGDNRDDSADSRAWGYVPERNLIGKGFFIWMNWDSQTHRINWHRIGTVL
jgi:signal peptidase I